MKYLKFIGDNKLASTIHSHTHRDWFYNNPWPHHSKLARCKAAFTLMKCCCKNARDCDSNVGLILRHNNQKQLYLLCIAKGSWVKKTWYLRQASLLQTEFTRIGNMTSVTIKQRNLTEDEGSVQYSLLVLTSLDRLLLRMQTFSLVYKNKLP